MRAITSPELWSSLVETLVESRRVTSCREESGGSGGTPAGGVVGLVPASSLT